MAGRLCSAMCNGQAIGIHTGAGRQCTDAMHTHGYEKWGRWKGKKQNGAAYVMPGWVGRMVSLYLANSTPR